MFKKSKSQAAMEFLSTYGWAFIIIIVAMGAYLSMFSPYSVFSDKIDFGSGIHVVDFTYGYFEFEDTNIGNFEIYIKNAMGTELEDITLTINECNNNLGKVSEKFDLQEAETYKILLTCYNIETVMDGVNKYSGILNFSRKTGGEYIHHSRNAEIIVRPSDIIDFPDTNEGRRIFALRNHASGMNDENRFYPCDNVPGCTNPDSTGSLKSIFGGYVDSKTGLVWSDESPINDTVWAIRDEIQNSWDKVSFEWNYDTEEYERCDTCGPTDAKRNDLIGSAFTYCVDLTDGGKTNWKLPSLFDYDGLFDCNQCLPPYGKYQTTSTLGHIKYYWTETNDFSDDYQAMSIIFYDNRLNPESSNTKSLPRAVRCVRDNP